MSNTGLKGISRVEVLRPPKQVKYGYQVYVGWQNQERREFVQDVGRGTFDKAVRLRNQFERQLGKPRTESHIRASGTTPHTTWSRGK